MSDASAPDPRRRDDAVDQSLRCNGNLVVVLSRCLALLTAVGIPLDVYAGSRVEGLLEHGMQASAQREARKDWTLILSCQYGRIKAILAGREAWTRTVCLLELVCDLLDHLDGEGAEANACHAVAFRCAIPATSTRICCLASTGTAVLRCCGAEPTQEKTLAAVAAW